MTDQFDIMIAGHLCLDIIPRFLNSGTKNISEIMRPGKLINVKEAAISTGGPVSNTGLNMKTLGSKVCFCACVGDDLFGRIALEILQKNGNAEGVKIIKGYASSYTIVVAPPGIDRIFIHNPGTNDIFTSGDLNVDVMKRCRHFHFGYPPLMKRMYEHDGDELTKVFKLAKQGGTTTSCDMALPDPDSESGKVNWRNILKRTLPYIDMWLASIEETFYMLYPEKFMQMKGEHNNAELIDHITPGRYSRIADEILSMGSKMVALKSGQRGFYLKTAYQDTFGTLGAAKPADYDNWSKRELWIPAFKTEHFVSAAGSGDSSIAGLLSGYLRGLSIEDSLKYAVCCGFQNVQVLDAVSGIKTWDETTAMLQTDMPTIEMNIKEKNWCWSQTHKLWAGPKDPLNK